MKKTGKYALNAEIGRFLKGRSNDQIQQFIDEVHRISQSRCPVKTGYLKSTWYQEPLSGSQIKFGYYADYAMPVDHENGFFTASIRQAKQKFLKKWGADALRGIREIEPSTKPGEFD
ncbi:hypothetical protein GF357_05095 [Candidatus Dojkabacteria bacterium]|nr:hypothetical protein [Candidatus Dojkabacteria bacterium]